MTNLPAKAEADRIIAEIGDMKNVTPGTWRASFAIGVTSMATGERVAFCDARGLTPEARWANAGHIAVCSPDNIKKLVDHIRALEAENADLREKVEWQEAVAREYGKAVR